MQEASAYKKGNIIFAHGVSAVVTDVIAPDEHGDHFPVVFKINTL